MLIVFSEALRAMFGSYLLTVYFGVSSLGHLTGDSVFFSPCNWFVFDCLLLGYSFCVSLQRKGLPVIC